MLLSWLFSRKRKETTPQRTALLETLEDRKLLAATLKISPAPPSDLKANASSSTAIKLNWSDNSTRESGYKIERSTDGKKFSQLNVVGKNVNSYTSGNLTKGKRYYYRVRAYNEYGNSSYTNTANATPGTSTAASKTPTSSSSSSTTLKISPAPPSNLKATVSSSTAIKLDWSDNSTRESGYKIERSTDGKNFSQLAVVGKDVSSYTNGNLTKGKKYYYRVRAYNEYGNSNFTNTANATPGSSTSSSGTTTSTPSSSSSKSSKATWANGGKGEYASGQWYFDGVNIGIDHPDQVKKIIPVLKSLHVGSVRIWWGMKSWGNRSGNWAIQEAQMFKDAGFKVMMNVGVADVPSYNEAKAFFNYVKNKPGALKAVDIWEIGNEPNKKEFWKGTPSQYVNNVLKAAWDALHPAGAKIAGAGPTWDVDFCKILVDAGYLKYVDYANFHPYGPSPEAVQKRALGAKEAFKGKPLIFSEWNVRGSEDNPNQWAKNVDKARKLIAPIADIAFYFPFKVGNTMAGKGGLVNSSFAKRNPFYDMFKKWGE